MSARPAAGAGSGDRPVPVPEPVTLWLVPADRPGGLVRLYGPAVDRTFEGLRSTVATDDLLAAAERRPLEGVLDPALAAELEALLAAGPVVLNLADRLPEAWHHLPWEWLRRDGRPLGRELLVVRHRPATAEPAPEALAGPRLFASLFPPEDLPDGDPVGTLPAGLETLWHPDEARAHLEREDLSTLGALFVYSHGSEAAGPPLRLPGGRTWALPEDRGWPPLLALIACGDAHSHLIRYARERVASGAHAVLVAQGQLDAAQALGFVADFQAGLDGGASVGAALLAARRNAAGDHGALRLLPVGRADLAAAETGPATAELAEEVGQALAEGPQAAMAAGLPALAERLGQRAALGEDGDDAPGEILMDRLGDLDPERERVLALALEAAAERVAPVVRPWVLALAQYLYEYHDHGRMAALAARQEPLPDALVPRWHHFHGWAKAEYRQGRYPRVLQLLADLLPEAAGSDPCTGDRPRAWGLLLNTAVDLALPALGEAAAARIDGCLDRLAPADAAEERFKRLDGKARLALRQGRLARAAALFAEKRRLAGDFGQDPLREQVAQTFAAAWDPEAEPGEAGNALLAAFADDARVAAWVAEAGNSGLDYAFRALALWAWRGGGEAVQHRLRALREPLEGRLGAARDPGPLGKAVAFLRLADPGSEAWGRLWEGVQPRLAEHRYHLELAALHWLLAEPEFASAQWQRFRELRRQALSPWTEGARSHLAGRAAADLAAERDAREGSEAKILAEEPAPMDGAVTRLAAAGMLPL
jgi:hypothetical protein